MLLRYFDKMVTRARQIRHAPDNAVVDMSGGYKLSLRPNSDRHERQLYFDRCYEPATLALFSAVLRSGDTMVDVGANLGIMSLHASKSVGATGAVVAIEPHPVTFLRLVEHIRINDSRSIRPIQIAAGKEPGQSAIFDAPAVNIGRASLIDPGKGSEFAGKVTVDLLDNILASFGLESVRLLKIDVEGFEANVLKGATKTLTKQPVICMEVSASIQSSDNEPLAGHDIIMATGLYAAYTFRHGKGRASPLVDVSSRSQLARQVNDNVVYIPHSIRSELPIGLFSS
jgi:FkbM family methyltransferase